MTTNNRVIFYNGQSKVYNQLLFTFSVFWVALTAYLTGAFPEYAKEVFTIKAIILLLLRAYVYFSTESKYFMWEFCYFANFLILAYLHFFSESILLFKIVYACSLGPLSLAVVAWRNSLVFHSLDKMTSVFIHLGPPLLMYELRWLQNTPFVHTNEFNQINWYESLAYPMCFYLFWQTYYFIRIEYLTAETIEANNMLTAFRYWTSEKQKNTQFYKIIHMFGDQWAQPMYMLFQFTITTLAFIPVKFIYSNQWLHFVYYMVLFGACVWNGAGYYFEVFAKRYYKSD